MTVVSVILPTHNGSEVVGEAVESILAQTLKNLELIVVDDGSTDETVALLRRHFKDPRLQLIEMPENRGVATARNVGMARARGELFAFMDQDDVALPHRLTRQAGHLARTDWLAVGSAVRLFGERDGTILPETDPEVVAASTVFSCEFIMPSMLFRRSAFERYGPFAPTYRDNCDWEMIGRLMRHGKIGNLPEVLLHYRRWTQQVTSRIIDTIDCRATRIRSDLLEWVGVPLAEQDLAAHVLCAPGYWTVDKQVPQMDAARIECWLEQVRLANRKSGRLNEVALERVFTRCRAEFSRLEARSDHLSVGM